MRCARGPCAPPLAIPLLSLKNAHTNTCNNLPHARRQTHPTDGRAQRRRHGVVAGSGGGAHVGGGRGGGGGWGLISTMTRIGNRFRLDCGGGESRRFCVDWLVLTPLRSPVDLNWQFVSNVCVFYCKRGAGSAFDLSNRSLCVHTATHARRVTILKKKAVPSKPPQPTLIHPLFNSQFLVSHHTFA
jgi:hypothetical protein